MNNLYAGRALHACLGLLLPAVLLWPAAGQAQSSIKKCQDADGNWHYGDFAAEECARSKITEMSESGTKIGEELPPATAVELEWQWRREAERRYEAEAAAKQHAEDAKLIATYASKDVIVATRDRHLGEIDRTIAVTRQLREGILRDITDLQARKPTAKVKKQIAEREKAVTAYDRVVLENLREREKLQRRYSDLLNRFDTAKSRLREGATNGTGTPATK
ncbi:MAG: hypothetical protein U9Q71_02880 [Pseudomonadota bacterium]|nr:hypothetical protein [Pseudomonadota bacterium]